jgi:hypothetical protein
MNNNSFSWYVTTIDLDDPMLFVCLDCLKKYSRFPINGILVPKFIYDKETIQTVSDIPVFYINTTVAGFQLRRSRGRSCVKRNGCKMYINEEHFRLIGHGVKKFPSLIIDGDVWVIDKNIDQWVCENKDKLEHRSSFLYLKDSQCVWMWDKGGSAFSDILRKNFKFEDGVPFIHFLSAFFKKRPKRYHNRMEELISFLQKKGFTKDYFLQYDWSNRSNLLRSIINMEKKDAEDNLVE